MERDKEVTEYLLKTGWEVLRFWGNQIETDTLNCVKKIESELNEAKRKSVV